MVTRWPLVGRNGELAELRRRLEAPRGPRGVAVFGDAGVGKTRLVTELVEACRRDGITVEWVRATEAASRIPLGSLAHLLAPGDDAFERSDLLHLALARLRDRAGGDDFLLAVDDAHLLDAVSVALLHLAATQSPVRLLISVRTGEPLPPGLVGLWKDELLARHDVRPLSRDATEDLVFAALGDRRWLESGASPARSADGPVDTAGTGGTGGSTGARVPASLLDRIWRLSRGNALFVRELILAAVERQEAGGGGGPVVLPAGGSVERLRELVEERLRLLEPGWRAALETIAVGEQVPLDAVERLTGPGDVETLEQRGLVEVLDGDHGGVVQVAHPLYGEVLAASLPRVRRRTLLRDLVTAVDELDRRRASATSQHDVDPLRVASWRLESGEPGDPEQLLQLAREALGRLDHQLAERLALAAGGPSRAEAGLVAAEALSGQGRMDEAAAILARLHPTEPELVARVAIARASDLFLHLDRSGEAFEVLQTAVEELDGHPAARADCQSVLAQMCMFSLRLDEAERLAEGLLASPDVPDAARVRAVGVAVTVRGARGRPDASLALIDDDLYALARRHRREVPYGDIQLRMARFQALYWAGRARDLDAYTAGNLGLDIDPPPSLRGILSGFRGGALLVRGRARAALAELQRSTRTLAESDWFGQKPLAEAMRARAAVFAGEAGTAAEAIQAADAAYAKDSRRAARTLPYIELSRAWLLAAQGAVDDAAERCLALARLLEPTSVPLAVEVLHAAVRLGRAGDALPLMERLGEMVDGPLAPLAVRHTVALARGDADLLSSVAGGFEELGADLLAAEAHRSAANAHRRAGRGASAAAAGRRVDELLRRCDGPSSPALEPPLPVGEELTSREREIARLAAGGRTSPEIAGALYLSVRTVDTHLHRVYRKLMIEGRHQLAEALGMTGEG